MDMEKIPHLLKGKGKKILIYHTDLDGVCSAILMLKFFRGFELIPREGPIVDDRFLKELAGKKPDLMVVLDIPIDQEWKKIELLQRKLPRMRILLIDHHVPNKNLGSERNIHINPRFEKNVYIPSSCQVYRLLEGLGHDVKPYVWIAAIGIIGDYGFEDCKDVIDECRKAYPDSMGKDPMKSNLKEVSDYILSALILHGTRGVEKSLKILLGMDNFGAVTQNGYFASCEKKVTGEIRRILSDFEKRKREYHNLDLVIYRIESRLNITSTISTLVAERNPDKIIIITKYSGQYVKISARCQAGDIDLNSLLKETVAGIGSGGGHEKAAGAMVKRKDVDEFNKRLIEKITELKTKL